jgi:hypothetical protein
MRAGKLTAQRLNSGTKRNRQYSTWIKSVPVVWANAATFRTSQVPLEGVYALRRSVLQSATLDKNATARSCFEIRREPLRERGCSKPRGLALQRGNLPKVKRIEPLTAKIGHRE